VVLERGEREKKRKYSYVVSQEEEARKERAIKRDGKEKYRRRANFFSAVH
jgi:hypothetical protein